MKKKFNKIYLLILLIVIGAAIAAGIYGYKVVYKEKQLYKKYEQAFELYKQGEYESAETILKTISGYKGVSVLMQDISYQKGVLAYEAEDYAAARKLFLKVSDYQDSKDYIRETSYWLGMEAYHAKDFDLAKGYFEEIPDYKDVSTYMEDISFIRLKETFSQGAYAESEVYLFEISKKPGVEPYALVVLEALGKTAYEDQKYERAMEMYRLALEYSSWVDTYEAMQGEEKAAYAPIAGEVDFRQRLKNIEEEQKLAEREYQAILCLMELTKYYENELEGKAVLTQIDEIRFALQTFTNEAVVPLIMISYKETVDGKKSQSYAAYNETEIYGICHSLKMEEVDKSNPQELQAYLKITDFWEDKGTVEIDMVRVRKAMGWE